ncbi:MAG: hypothetical protein NCW75_07210 [Phycisphaera sp.]|nr:MAG: hypothetical protein NCW75_07210 [Phycisphaera sp.]
MRSMKMNMGTAKALRVASGNLAARRGSTLILVVATLALLAVLTVAYVSIGGGDRRSARTTVRAAEVERQAQHIGDYLIGIVGDDALSVYFEGYDPSGEPIFKTEAVDLPRTDFNRTFDGSPVTGTPEPQLSFYGRAFTPIGSLPPLQITDNPTAAASTIFSDLRPFGPSDPFLAASEPVYIRQSGDPFNSPAYADRVDWPKISNVGPNGLYVNLFNLRGNFDAEPGIGVDASGDDRTSENLFLTQHDGSPTTNLVYGGSADPQIPAHFDSRLVGSFRPVDFDNGFTVDDEEYMPYMWADADGDGFFDSRWQELVDVVVPGSPGTFLPRNVIPSEGQLRWFVATRIVDLSSKVNVNTARSILQPLAVGGGYDGAPTNGFRLGASPADIDLRRLLTLENSWAMFDEFYDAAPQPTGGAQDYSDYDNYDDARDIANQGYWAMSRVLSGEQPPAGPLTPGVDPQMADERRDEYSLLRRSVDTPLRTDIDGVYRQYAFGLEDLSDLLAFNGLNNPQSLSSLERAVGGRLTTLPFEFFSPLRENRSLQWERDLTDPDAALALRHIGVRQHLTTLSGGIPRVPSLVRYPSASPSALDVYTSSSSLPESTVALDPGDENPTVLQDGYRLLNLASPSDLPESNPTLEVEERLKRNAHPMFRTYGNALMPSAGEAGAWTPSGSDQWQSTFYGFDRLFALRTAAHTTANMIDMFDGDDIPSAFTVLVDSANRSAMSGFAEFPWWNQPEPMSSNPGVSGRLDMGDERLPSGADAGGVIAMNVYGLEVHPFITQVSLYNIFTDSPEDAPSQGDAEYDPPTGGGGGPIFGPGGGSSNPVTIDFEINTSPSDNNSDFVGQVFAVQLTNPYTTDIEVRNNQYFVRFGELGGPVASPALSDGLEIPAGTRIPRGESIVLYYDTIDLAQRASDAAASFFSVSSGQVETWINLHMMGAPNDPAVRFDPPNVNVQDFLAGPPGGVAGDSDANREVTLWTRLNRDAAGGADTTTDVLLDRLFDPADLNDRPTLDRRPPATNTDIAGTAAGPEDMTAADALDNTGYSIVTWGTIARPTGTAMAPFGALPAYVLEKPFTENGQSFNMAKTDDLMLPAPLTPGFSINRGQFVGGGKLDSAERALVDIFSNGGGSTGGMTAQIPTEITLPATDPTTMDHRFTITPGEQSSGLGFDDLYMNPLRNDNRGLLNLTSSTGVRMLRPGDFLGVPAVGPVQMPGNSSATATDLDWFTTGELLTLALGYDLAPPSNSPDAYPSLPENTFDLLDRGHLSLDLPAPYVDRDTTGDFTTGDERRGLGVPHAMAVMSSITTIDAPVNTRTPIAGLVNLNTATEATTSVLPGLTPTYESTIDPALSWINDDPNVLHDHRSDVAAGIRAYRDKSGALTRDGTSVDFLDPGAWGDMDPQDLFGRQTITGLDGIREHSGLLSVGEMLAADTLPTGGPVLGPSTYARPHMIRRLGQDGESLAVDGVDAVRYSASGLVDQAAGTRDDGIADDYDEQLALFNGVANTVTVRSDVYAIWFVMHGYAPEDVEGLRPEDPMVPSIARRYLIVVDRSNVRRAGDKPRVLLFDELPL